MTFSDPAARSFWSETTDPPAAAGEDSPAQRDGCYICGQPGHFSVACRFHPARLRKISGEACGPGPCTSGCRSGDHGDCGFSWCECVCHDIPLQGA